MMVKCSANMPTSYTPVCSPLQLTPAGDSVAPLETPLACEPSVTALADNYLDKDRGVPAFLSALTLDLFSKETTMM